MADSVEMRAVLVQNVEKMFMRQSGVYATTHRVWPAVDDSEALGRIIGPHMPLWVKGARQVRSWACYSSAAVQNAHDIPCPIPAAAPALPFAGEMRLPFSFFALRCARAFALPPLAALQHASRTSPRAPHSRALCHHRERKAASG